MQGELSEHAIRAQLDRILSSPGFVNADRLARFLRYVAEETLRGDGDKLKETLVAIEVFGRSPTYDPRQDAIVRTEAVKLRARLKEYYDGSGREDPILIDLPKGRYIPAFTRREAAPRPGRSSMSARWLPVRVGIGVMAMVVIAAAVTIWKTHPETRPAAAMPRSIAVLPFVDLSEAKDQAYFCDGITEQIIDALAKVDGLRVVARSSAFAFKGKSVDVREVGRVLTVDAVLEGSIRKAGNRVRVTAQLNSTSDGYHLWSETYERELKDIFAVQDDISRAIATRLRSKGSDVRVAQGGTTNLKAYNSYLQGRFQHWKWTPENVRQGLRHFEEAIAEDPKYASAYAELANSYCWLGFFGVELVKDTMPKAKVAAEKAISLNDQLGAAHLSLGFVKSIYEWDWKGAEREFKRALELSPGDAAAHFGYSIVLLSPMERHDEAVREMRIARDLDPLSIVMNSKLALVLVLARRYDEGIRQYKAALEMDPSFKQLHTELVMAYAAKRDFDSARKQLEEWRRDFGPNAGLLDEAHLLALAGRRKEAEATIGRAMKLASSDLPPTKLACIFAGMEDSTRAMESLEKAFQHRDGMLVFAKVWPPYDPLRSDPRFQRLLERLNFPR